MTPKIKAGASHVGHPNWRQTKSVVNFAKNLFDEMCFTLLLCKRHAFKDIMKLHVINKYTLLYIYIYMYMFYKCVFYM